MSNREQFEAWYLENWGHTEDNHESLFERCQDGCGDEYYRFGVRMAYEAWQAASKASEQQLAAVVAENAGLKNVFGPGDAVLNFLTIALRHTTYDQIDLSDVTLAFQMSLPKTPATDAAIAKIQAQGVEMFASSLKVLGPHEHPYSTAAKEFAASLRQGAAL